MVQKMHDWQALAHLRTVCKSTIRAGHNLRRDYVQMAETRIFVSPQELDLHQISIFTENVPLHVHKSIDRQIDMMTQKITIVIYLNNKRQISQLKNREISAD